jgi:hypothetical protein
MLTDARILAALTLRARVAVKRELLGLWRAHDAAAAFLWTASPMGGKAFGIEYVGSREALPRSTSMQGPITHLCEQRTLRGVDGEEREVVLLYSRMCNDAPVLLLGLVDPGEPFTDVLTASMEDTASTLEMVVVDVLDPARSIADHAPGRPLLGGSRRSARNR